MSGAALECLPQALDRLLINLSAQEELLQLIHTDEIKIKKIILLDTNII